MVTLSLELRVPVPTVGTIQLVLFPKNNTFTVMVHNLNCLILTLDKSSTRQVNIIGGLLGVAVIHNCCSYSPQQSP